MATIDESPRRKELRIALHQITSRVTDFQQHSLSQGDIPNVSISPMSLDSNSNSRPIFFAQYTNTSLCYPDDTFDRLMETEYDDFDSLKPEFRKPINCARVVEDYFSYYVTYYLSCQKLNDDDIPWSPVSILDQPFVDLYQFSYPKFGPTWIVQVKDNNKQQPSHSHLKVLIYNNLDGVDGKLYRGEVILALRLMAAQLRRLRFIKHLVAPVLLFSFMGPQHARIIEAFFTGTTLVLRPSRLYDFREKDQAAFRHFAQWYFGKPIGDTMALPESSD